ncbi:MAG: hypothetical protein ACRD7E_27580 [Bryobacteraceae bacterium]
MNVTIDLSEDSAAVLASQARAAHMPTERYLAHIVERALQSRHRQVVAQLEQHLNEMGSQTSPETTSEEMEAALEEALVNVRPRRTWRS